MQRIFFIIINLPGISTKLEIWYLPLTSTVDTYRSLIRVLLIFFTATYSMCSNLFNVFIIFIHSSCICNQYDRLSVKYLFKSRNSFGVILFWKDIVQGGYSFSLMTIRTPKEQRLVWYFDSWCLIFWSSPYYKTRFQTLRKQF